MTLYDTVQYSIIKSNIVQKDKIHDSAIQYCTVWCSLIWYKLKSGIWCYNRTKLTARTLYKNLTKCVNTQGRKKKHFSHHPNSFNSVQSQVCLAWRHAKFAKVTNRSSDAQSPRNWAGRLSVAGALTPCVCLPDHKRCKCASGMRQAGDKNGKKKKRKQNIELVI